MYTGYVSNYSFLETHPSARLMTASDLFSIPTFSHGLFLVPSALLLFVVEPPAARFYGVCTVWREDIQKLGGGWLHRLRFSFEISLWTVRGFVLEIYMDGCEVRCCKRATREVRVPPADNSCS